MEKLFNPASNQLGKEVPHSSPKRWLLVRSTNQVWIVGQLFRTQWNWNGKHWNGKQSIQIEMKCEFEFNLKLNESKKRDQEEVYSKVPQSKREMKRRWIGDENEIQKNKKGAKQKQPGASKRQLQQCIIIHCCRVIPSNNCPAGRQGDYYSLPQTCPILPGSRARRNRITFALPWQKGWMDLNGWFIGAKVDVEAYEIEMKGLRIQAGRIQLAMAASQLFNPISCCVILHNHEYLYSNQFHSAFDLNLSCVLAPKSCQAVQLWQPKQPSIHVGGQREACSPDGRNRAGQIDLVPRHVSKLYMYMSMCSIQLKSCSIIACTTLLDIL